MVSHIDDMRWGAPHQRPIDAASRTDTTRRYTMNNRETQYIKTSNNSRRCGCEIIKAGKKDEHTKNCPLSRLSLRNPHSYSNPPSDITNALR